MLDLEYSRGAFSQSVLVLILVLSAWHMVSFPSYQHYFFINTDSPSYRISTSLDCQL